MKPIRPGQIERLNLAMLLELAKAEDLGGGDVTSQEFVPRGQTVAGRFVAREAMTFCGGVFLGQIAKTYSPHIRTRVLAAEGVAVRAGAVLAEWRGPARAVLAAERVALNFLQRLSGVATLTKQFVEAAVGDQAGHDHRRQAACTCRQAEIFDTRKTTPGWRMLEKYAVRAGGGRNHRIGLFDAVLVKDNHLAALAAGGCDAPIAALSASLARARERLGRGHARRSFSKGGGFVEIEVDTLEQLAAALKLPVDVILLDNMSVAQLRKAVAMRDAGTSAGRRKIELEASGGVTLRTVRAVARTGVERISVGAITHSAVAVDIALDMTMGD